MKKLFIFVLITALALTVTLPASVTSFADGVMEQEDFEDEGNNAYVMWDRVEKDGVILGADGNPFDYLEDCNYVVAGPASTVDITGWTASSQPIKAFGYMLDDGTPVLSEEYVRDAEQAVLDAAAIASCEFANRYLIIVNTEGMEGLHKITFLCQVEDGSVFIMTRYNGDYVEFYYSADGKDVPGTPEPTEIPDYEQLGDDMGPIFRFDAEDKYVEGGFFYGQSNSIDSVTFDEEKKCFVIHMDNSMDPWIILPFLSAANEDESLFVDADKYKIMQIGLRYTSSAGSEGQFFFQTDEYGGFDEPKDVKYKLGKTDDIQFVNVNLGRNKKWTGVMLDSRIDPLVIVEGVCDYEIYYFAFFTNAAAADAFGNKWLAEGDSAIPTPAPTPTKEPTAEPTETPVVTPVPENTVAPTEETHETEKPSNGGKEDKSGVNPGVIIGIAAGIVVVAGVVAAIIAISKKKKK